MKRNSFLFLFLVFCSFSIKAQNNYAFNFTNRTDIVTIGDADRTPPWTAEMWVYKKAATDYSTLLNGSTSKLELETWGKSHQVGITKKGTADWAFPKGYVVPLTTWTHLAWTCDGTKTYLYVNGVKQDELAQVINLPMTTIGNAVQTQSPNVYLDEIRLWKVAKSAAQLTAGMSLSADPKDPNLVGYWYCDDQANPANDISPVGRTCAMSGTKYAVNTNPFTTTISLPAQVIKGAACEQYNEYKVKAKASYQDVLLINIKVEGITDAKKVTSITIGTNGTTDLADIKNVRMYYSGSQKAFVRTNPYGIMQVPAASLTFTELQTLSPGNNYFWVSYDMASMAGEAHKLDAICTSISVEGEPEIIPVPNDPPGFRIIQEEDPVQDLPVSVIPKPVSLVQNQGSFTFTETTKIIADTAVMSEATVFAELLKRSTGYNLAIVNEGLKENNISLEILDTLNAELGEEGYLLYVTSTGITVQANTPAGIYYATQTIRQLLPVAVNSLEVQYGVTWSCPNVSIKDYPRFVWRGFLLDVSRHFFSVNDVKRYIDLMAMNKLNVFHWHLIDDQGFRMEVKSHPELTTLASSRPLCPGENTKYDQGYYTQEEIKDIVAYALVRHVNVEPELESPGHAAAWLAALPGLTCTNVVAGSQHVQCMSSANSSVNNNIPHTICMGKDYTYAVMQDVIDEMAELFPFKYVHIGGDEADHTPWTTCADCQKRMADNGITSVGGAQTYYLKRIQSMFATHGKKVVGWSEMGILNTNCVLQDWIGGGDNAVNNGAAAIYSNAYSFYLDSYQGATNEPACMSWMGNNTIDEVYNYAPSTAGLSAAKKKLVLGIEACLWSEYNFDTTIVEYRMLPRLYAVAETGWTQEETKDYTDFAMRLYFRSPEIDYLNYNYSPLAKAAATADESTITGECSGTVTLSAGFGSEFYYWNDDARSTTSSLTVNKSGTYKVYGEVGTTRITRIFNVTIPQPSTIISITNTLHGENATYKGTDSSYVYRWYDAAEDGNLIATADSCVIPIGSPLFVSQSLIMPQYSLQFNGDNYVSAPALNIKSNTVTYEAWIKRSGAQNDIAGIIFNRGTSAYGLNIRSNGQLMYHWKDSFWDWNSGLTVPDDKWVHVAMVITPTSATIYMNNQSATNIGSHAAESFAEATKIGYDQQSRYFKGLIDEVRIWNVARTKEEILSTMYTQLTGTEGHLIAYYKMNESTGTTTVDEVTGLTASLNSFSMSDWNTSASSPVPNAMCESNRWDATIPVEVTSENVGISSMIYPNPNDGSFTAVVAGEDMTGIVRWFDLTGRTLNIQPSTVHISSSLMQLDYQNVPKGGYLMEIIQKNKRMKTFKVMVQ